MPIKPSSPARNGYRPTPPPSPPHDEALIFRHVHGGISGMKTPLFLILASAGLAHGQIHADVSTNLGSFSIRLNESAAPQTVANFITLAEGTRPWIHPVTGAIHSNEPFYNGIIFHRVIDGFMSQTGSKKGDGTDGPGYNFRDETNNGLSHSTAHVVSMANSGPDTNGSQFFITDAPTTYLDGIHTVFGVVTSGQAVVDTINAVATDANDRPLTPVIIENISIRREGATALAFNEHAQLLPLVARPKVTLQSQTGTSPSVLIDPPLTGFSRLSIHRSLDLAAWQSWGSLQHSRNQNPISLITGIEPTPPPKAFYQISTVTWQDDATFSNASQASYQISYPTETRSYVFNANGTGGSVTITPNAGSPTTLPFTLIDQGYSLYTAEFIVDHGDTAPPPRYLYHTLSARFSPTGAYRGNITSEAFVGFWQSWKTGTFTATR